MQEVLTIGVRDAAAILGVSPWSIRRWVRLGRLPAVKLGRRTVIELRPCIVLSPAIALEGIRMSKIYRL
jgi:excisionase family DNA binding protein